MINKGGFLATNFHELTRIREFHEWGGIANSAQLGKVR